MDSPEAEKAATISTATVNAAPPSSGSPPVQDSPVFSYISNLSPIKPVKAAHVARGLLELGSPPLVFTSPRINSFREANSSGRPPLPRPFSTESKKSADISDVFEKPIAQLNKKLISEAKNLFDNKESVQSCGSSVCVDEYLTDPAEVGSANSSHSDISSSKQANDLIESSQSGSIDLKNNVNSKIKKDERTEVNASLALSEQAHEEIQGASRSNAKPVETEMNQNDADTPSAKVLDTGSNLSMSHAFKRTQCEHSVLAHNDCSKNTDAILNGSVRNPMLHDFEASPHQRGMLRRCLQFEDAMPSPVTNRENSWSPMNTATLPCSPAIPLDVETLDLIHADLNATSSSKHLVNLSQPVTKMFSSQNREKPCFGASKPSSIGLHLNSIVNALPVGCSASANLQLAEKTILSVQRMESESDIDSTLLENEKGSTMSLGVLDKTSISTKDGRHGTTASNAQSSTSQYLHRTKPVNNPLKQSEHSERPNDKRKTDSEHADNFEVLNQMSPNKRRKKSSSPNGGDNVKRCNCKKTKCLKLYCDCFAAGLYCAESCACQGCFNRPEYDDTVSETRQQIESRNPLAFAPKIQQLTETPANTEEKRKWLTPSSARHKRGCNCKKSMCLKKYCECYQANVGCSDGCRCMGCKNVYGIKEDYGLTKQIVSKRAPDERLETRCHEDSGIASSGKKFNTELSAPQSWIPLTPLFQCTNRGKDGSNFLLPSRRDLPSPESGVTFLSTYERSTNSLRMPLETREKIPDIACVEKSNLGNAEVLDQSTPRCGFASTWNLAPLASAPSITSVSSTSSKPREETNDSHSQLCPQSGRPSSSGSLRWRSSPLTPMPRSGSTNFLQGLEPGCMLHDIQEDDTPEILKDASTINKAVKVSSPNQKRISPPHSHLHELGSSFSAGLRSGRKFILKAIPSFPPLTPCVESKNIGHESGSNTQGGGISK